MSMTRKDILHGLIFEELWQEVDHVLGDEEKTGDVFDAIVPRIINMMERQRCSTESILRFDIARYLEEREKSNHEMS